MIVRVFGPVSSAFILLVVLNLRQLAAVGVQMSPKFRGLAAVLSDPLVGDVVLLRGSARPLVVSSRPGSKLVKLAGQAGAMSIDDWRRTVSTGRVPKVFG